MKTLYWGDKKDLPATVYVLSEYDSRGEIRPKVFADQTNTDVSVGFTSPENFQLAWGELQEAGLMGGVYVLEERKLAEAMHFAWANGCTSFCVNYGLGGQEKVFDMEIARGGEG